MAKKLIFAAAMVTSVAISPDLLLAQGQGGGHHRGLAAAAKAAAAPLGAPGIRGAGPRDISRRPLASGASMNNVSGSLQRSNGGLRGNTGGIDDLPASSPAAPRPQQILDQRLQQADHLRAISDRNGNEHLAQTADRMTASAQTNFQRQQAALTAHGNDVPPAPATPAPATPAAGSPPIAGSFPPAAAAPANPPRAARGFWFRSR
jgi:hypothetical protein